MISCSNITRSGHPQAREADQPQFFQIADNQHVIRLIQFNGYGIFEILRGTVNELIPGDSVCFGITQLEEVQSPEG